MRLPEVETLSRFCWVDHSLPEPHLLSAGALDCAG
jgi:hypothetical protein